MGSQGLRAGWGLLLFVVLTALAAVGFVLVMSLTGQHFDPAKITRPTPEVMDFVEALTLVPILIATAAMALIERRSLAAYGFGLGGFASRFAQGLAAGLGMLALLVGLIFLLGGIAFERVALQGADAWSWGVRWGLTFLLVGATEEVLLRGYVLQTLARGVNFRWATLLTSSVFLALHLPNKGETLLGLASVALIGVVFSLSIWRTGTVWWAIGFHAAWDWAQSFLFGVADSGHPALGALMVAHPVGPAWLSGGATGPEGSALVLPVEALTVGLILLTQRKRDQALAVKA